MPRACKFAARKTLITENPNVPQTIAIRNSVKCFDSDVMSENVFAVPNRKNRIELLLAYTSVNGERKFVPSLPLFFFPTSGHYYGRDDREGYLDQAKQKDKAGGEAPIRLDLERLRDGHKHGEHKSRDNIQ